MEKAGGLTPEREAEIRKSVCADYDYGDAERISGEGQELLAEIDRLRASVVALRQARDAANLFAEESNDRAERAIALSMNQGRRVRRAEQRIPPGMTPERLEKLADFVDRYARLEGLVGPNEVRERVLGWAKWLREDPAPTGGDATHDASLLKELRRLLLSQPWHRKCDIILDYMPPYPRGDTRPTVQIRYNDGSQYPPFLRYSNGPKQGFFWDLYGEDMQTEALAILALSQAPAPVNVGPITFSIPLGPAPTDEPTGTDDDLIAQPVVDAIREHLETTEPEPGGPS